MQLGWRRDSKLDALTSGIRGVCVSKKVEEISKILLNNLNINCILFKLFKLLGVEFLRFCQDKQYSSYCVLINLDSFFLIFFSILYYFLKMGHSRPLFLYFCLFNTVDSKRFANN